MGETFLLATPLWEIAARGTAVYLAIALVFRLMPKRHTGGLAPNDMIALVIVGSVAADAIMGDAKALPDLLLMVLVIILWDYLFNLAEYYFPRFRGIAQDSPTLLIHHGVLLKDNLRREKLTEQALAASLQAGRLRHDESATGRLGSRWSDMRRGGGLRALLGGGITTGCRGRRWRAA